MRALISITPAIVGIVLNAMLGMATLPGATAAEIATGKQPQIAIDPAGTAFVVFGTDRAIFCATSTDRGKTFAEPVKVADVRRVALGMRRGPRIAAGEGAVIITAIASLTEDVQPGDLFVWRSTDRGQTWSDAQRINDVPNACREGLHDTAMAPDGKTACTVWLDLRRDRASAIFTATSRDGGVRWERNRDTYRSPSGRVCECCHPTVRFEGNSVVWVMFRNLIDGARDMYLMRSRDGGRSFGRAEKLGRGRWVLNACPMDGGALALDGSAVATVWRRENTMFLCAPGRAEIELGTGSQGWIAALGANRGVAVVWMVRRNGPIMIKLGDADAREIASRGNDPVIVAGSSPDSPILAAWESNNRVVVEIIRE